jgi:hypothetical protein
MTENDIAKLLDDRFATFAKQQQEVTAREKLLDRLEAHGVKSNLRPGYEDDLRFHFQRRAENGENLEAKGVAEHVAEYRKAKPNLFARTSPTTKDGTLQGVDDSGVTEKLDYGKPENSAAFRKLVAGWGIRVA